MQLLVHSWACTLLGAEPSQPYGLGVLIIVSHVYSELYRVDDKLTGIVAVKKGGNLL